MNKEFIRKWCEALRSGEYTQGRSLLRSVEDTYCCLGVACNLYDKNLWSTDLSTKAYTFNAFSSIILDSTVCTYISLDSDTICVLMRMNDDQKKSFTEIADYLEGKYLQ